MTDETEHWALGSWVPPTLRRNSRLFQELSNHACLTATGKHRNRFCKNPARGLDDSYHYLFFQAHPTLAKDSLGTSLIWLGGTGGTGTHCLDQPVLVCLPFTSVSEFSKHVTSLSFSFLLGTVGLLQITT